MLIATNKANQITSKIGKAYIQNNINIKRKNTNKNMYFKQLTGKEGKRDEIRNGIKGNKIEERQWLWIALRSRIISILCTCHQYINLGARLALFCSSSLFSYPGYMVFCGHLWGDVRAPASEYRKKQKLIWDWKITLSVQLRHLDWAFPDT